MTIQSSEKRLAFKFILPALIAMILVHVIPIVMGLYVSFIDLDRNTLTQLFGAPFCGLENYFDIFSGKTDLGKRFIQSIWNIIVFGVVVISFDFIIAMAVALLLNKDFRGRTLARGIILLPYITPDSVIYSVWRFIFQARVGLVNKYLLDWGLIEDPIIWLVGDNALITVTIAAVWKGWPYLCLIILAGLQNIPKDLYEAAMIDGANAPKRFWHITIPKLKPILKTLLVISTIWNFHAFNQFFIIFGGETSTKAAVPSIVILRAAFTNLHYGLGAAMATIMLLVIFTMTLLWVIFRKEEAV